MLQTCHATGWSYKTYFLRCQARHRRFHSVNWVDATPRGAASSTGLPKCSSCKSILLCHSTAWLTQLSPATQKFGSSSHFGKAAPQSLSCMPEEMDLWTPGGMCCSAAKMRPVLKGQRQPFEVSIDIMLRIIWHTGEFSARGHNKTQGLLQRYLICNCCQELKQGMRATVPLALGGHVAVGM